MTRIFASYSRLSFSSSYNSWGIQTILSDHFAHVVWSSLPSKNPVAEKKRQNAFVKIVWLMFQIRIRWCTNWFNQCYSLIQNRTILNWKQATKKRAFDLNRTINYEMRSTNEHAPSCKIMWWLMHNCKNWSAALHSNGVKDILA